MNRIDEAVQRAIDTKSQIYNTKRSCPQDRRDEELRYLYHLAEISPDGSTAEIGVRSGGSLLCWSMARKGRGDVYAIDDWSSPGKDIFYENIDRYGAEIKVYSMKSIEAAKVIADSFAFVFIDANHDTGIFGDIEAWTPKIIVDGIIAYHDYGVWKPTVHVKLAVDNWYRETKWEQLPQLGSTIAFRRPKYA